MADDQQPDDAELASAYLDGEATPDERARVEADPILLAEVERLRAAAAAVAAVDAPSVEQREAAVGAALATFDELRVTAAEPEPPTPPANVASLDRRRQARVMQALTAVAAVAVLVIGGFVVANREGPDDSAGDIRQAPATALGEGTAPATMAMVAAPTTTAPAESAADAAETARPTRPTRRWSWRTHRWQPPHQTRRRRRPHPPPPKPRRLTRHQSSVTRLSCAPMPSRVATSCCRSPR